MCYLLDCGGWSTGLTLVAPGAREALEIIASLREAGCAVERVMTGEGAPVMQFELHLLAEKNPIVVASRQRQADALPLSS